MNLSKEFFDNICRLCLTSRMGLSNIFESPQTLDRITECTNVIINIGDRYPLVCKSCIRKLNRSHSFKRRCEKSADILNKFKNFNNYFKTDKSTIVRNEEDKELQSNFAQNLDNKKKSQANRNDRFIEENNSSLLSDFPFEVEISDNTSYNTAATIVKKIENSIKIANPTASIEKTVAEQRQRSPQDSPYNEFVTFKDNGTDDLSKNRHTTRKSFDCSVCGKVFMQAGSLAVHYRSHTGERPFKCEICCKAFTQIGNLYVHKRIHTDVRDFKCSQCLMAFKLLSHLEEHKKTHSNIKEHQCTTCGKGFRKNSHLLIHLRTHTGEKPFTCEHCGKFFTDASNLATHIRIHTGLKPFICKHCNKGFVQKISMIRHEKMHDYKKSTSNTLERRSYLEICSVPNSLKDDMKVNVQKFSNVERIWGKIDTTISEPEESCNKLKNKGKTEGYLQACT